MSENETPTTGAGTVPRFQVWANATDSYSHTQLSANFDHIAGILGQPSDLSAWPATEGPGHGIWGEVEKLRRERAPLGKIEDLWIPWNASTSLSTIATYISTNLNALGWFVCDGSTVAPWNGTTGHMFDYVHGSSIQVPNLLNEYRIGADPTKAPSTAPAFNNSNSAAPGLSPGPTSAHGANASSVGSNVNSMTFIIPDHNHYYDHTHTLPNVNAFTTSSSGNGNTSPDTGTGITVQPVAFSGTTTVAASHGHIHNVTAGAALASGFTGAASAVDGRGGYTGAMTESGGAVPNTRQTMTIEGRPLSMACIPIIKLFYLQSPVANPYSFTGTGPI